MGKRKKTQQELVDEICERQGTSGYIIVDRDGWERVQELVELLDSHGTLGVAASEGAPGNASGTTSE